MKPKLYAGDITKMKVDAIVHAADPALLGGSAMDGAIYRAAGEELLLACRALDGCQTGQAKATLGYRLPAKHIIHTVGPVWRGGGQGEAQLLADCYHNSLSLAMELGCKSIAFPTISTGVSHYPVEQAVAIAMAAVELFASTHADPPDITFVCFNPVVQAAYRRMLEQSL